MPLDILTERNNIDFIESFNGVKTMKRIYTKDDFEVWAHYNSDIDAYELFASNEGDDFLGEAANLVDAKEYAIDWVAEQIANI
jgi:hypothetical protein